MTIKTICGKLSKIIRFLEHIIVLATVFTVLWNHVIKPNFFPTVTLICPPTIYSNEQVVFGNYSPARDDYRIRLYVYPIDGANRFWFQEQAWEAYSNGAWVDIARFGNPYGIDMKMPLPLKFKIFAALVKSDNIDKLPGYDRRQPWIQESGGDKAFMNRLKKSGVITVSKPFEILRLPEDICHSNPIVTSINNNSILSLNTKIIEVNSPVKLHWEPNNPMFIEVWKGGMQTLSEEMENDSELILQPGIQEIKVKPRYDYHCSASIWVNVLINQN